MFNETTKPLAAQNQIYTVKDIAAILNISERSAYNFVNKTTEFKVLRIGRCLRVNKQAFDAWMAGETHSAQPSVT